MTVGVPGRFDEPGRYQGAQVPLTPIIRVPRAPLVTDREYPLNQFWENVDKNATLPDAYGDLWYLAYFQSNGTFPADAIWIKMASGVNPPAGGVISLSDTANTKTFSDVTGNIQLESASAGLTIVSDPPNNKLVFTLPGGGPFIDQIQVQATTAPGVNPVTPDGSGQVTVNGNLVAAHGVPIETRTRALNTWNIEPQITTVQAISTLSANGMSHFNSANFTVDANGFVSPSGTGLIQTLTPDEDFDGSAPTPIAPQAGTIIVSGSTLAAATVTETYNSTGLATGNLEIEHRAWTTPFVVDASTTPGARGTFSTIQAAINAAVSGQTVFIRPGSYTENINMKAGVNLYSFIGNEGLPNTTIIGNITHNTAGTVAITGIRLQTNSGNLLTVSGAVASIINLNNCFINCTNNTGVSYTSSSSSSAINFYNCQGNITTTGITFITSSGAGTVRFDGTFINNSGASTIASTFSDGLLLLRNSEVRFGITTSSTCELQANLSIFNCFTPNILCLTHGGATSSAIINSTLTSNTNSCISVSSTITVSGTTFLTNTATVVSGAGNFVYASCNFYNNSGVTATTTTGQFQRPGRMILRTSAGGIGTSTANELSIYEEGTWTPTLVGGTTPGTTTYASQNGYYVRVGNMVTCYARIVITGATGTGQARVSLPFTVKNQTNGTVLGSAGITPTGATWPWAASTTSLKCEGFVNATYARFISFGSAVVSGYVGMDATGTTTVFQYSLTYQV